MRLQHKTEPNRAQANLVGGPASVGAAGRPQNLTGHQTLPLAGNNSSGREYRMIYRVATHTYIRQLRSVCGRKFGAR